MLQRALWILWPSFLVAGVAETAFFALFDPRELSVLEGWSRTAIYSAGFFTLWAFAAASSALTWVLGRSSDEINRCPLPAADRPAGCPKRAEPGECC
jgi:hypothetical protein